MGNVIVCLLAILLAPVLLPIGFAVWLVMRFIKDDRERYSEGTAYFLEVAYALDVLGNAACGELFSLVFLKHYGYKFGRRGETISSVLGKNYVAGTLSRTGEFFRKLVDKVDRKPNHCVRNIQQFPVVPKM